MRDSTINLLMDNLANLSNRIHAVEVAFVDYSEENPKSSSQWQEERLRALEHKISNVVPKQIKQEREWDDDDDDSFKLKLEMVDHTVGELAAKVYNLEYKKSDPSEERFNALWHDHGVLVQRFEASQANQGKTVKADIEYLEKACKSYENKIATLEFTVAELGLALGNLTKELRDMKDAKTN